MNASMNQFIFLILILCFISLSFYFFKLRKKNFCLKIQESRLDQSSQEVSKKQHEIEFVRRKLEEQKIKLEQEENRIETEREKLSEEYRRLKIEREKLAEESRRISEDKLVLEQEQNKLKERIQNVKEKFQEVIQAINKEAEQKFKELEREKKNFEIEKDKLQAAKKEIAEINKQVQGEWQKLKLEKQLFEKQQTELTDKQEEIKKNEQQVVEEGKFIENEKQRIEVEWRQIAAIKEEIEKHAYRLNEREKEIDERVRYLTQQSKLIETEKSDIENQRQEIQFKKEELENQKGELKEKIETIEKREKFLENKEIQLEARFKELAERETRLSSRNEEPGNSEIEPATDSISKYDKSDNKITRPPHRRTGGRTSELKQVNKKIRIIPELVCWEKNNCWYLGIQIPWKRLQDINPRIIQDGEQLILDDDHENCWALKNFKSLIINWDQESGIKEKSLPLAENENDFPLAFKLFGKNEKFGKHVKNPSWGAYCAIVPDSWQRDKDRSDVEWSEPEKFFITGYRVHFFYLRKYSGFAIAFAKPDGQQVIRDPKGVRFSLVGNQIPDANEESGPLFGNELPRINDSQSWQDIGTIIIGEEGEGIGKLRWEIQPDLNSPELDLNHYEKQGNICIFKSKRSWFFIRFYDINDKLIESIDFQYIQGLKKIEISNHSLLPNADGHKPVTIKFNHEDGCSIELLEREREEIVIRRDLAGTIATISNDPAFDITNWKIKDKSGREVEIAINLERIWWSLANESDHPDKRGGSDKPLELSVDKFKAFSNLGICIWLPKTDFRKSIFAGFDSNHRKLFLRSKTELDYIFIPFREFGDYECIQNFYEEQYLNLWLEEERDESIIIGIIRFPMLYCQVNGCTFQNQEKENMTNHIRDCHFNNFVKKLSYEEIRLKYNINWPKEIYKCGYCDYYAPADNNAINPTQAIIDHIEKECKQKKFEDGRAKITFAQIKDTVEIRTYVIPDLPEVHQCNICKKYFKNENLHTITSHLMAYHENILFDTKLKAGKGNINESNNT